MGLELQWLWKVESRRLLWLMGLTFALIVTFQYIELPYTISSIFSSTKIPISRNSTSLKGNLTLAMAPSFSQYTSTLGNESKSKTDSEEDEEEVKVDQIFDNIGNATARAISPTTSTLPASPAVSAETQAALPGLKLFPLMENTTISTKDDVGDASPVVRFVPDLKENMKMSDSGVMTISEMSKQLRRNRISHNHLAKKPKWVTTPDMELLQAKYEIENAPIVEKDPLLYSPLYRNVSIFKRSYELMENILKVYVYKEGNRPIMHNPILRGIYASEGWFMKLIESNNRFITKDSSKAHLFYLPFSSLMLEQTLYVQNSHSHKNLIKYLKDYIDFISVQYPFWNRTSGADHFLAACHDWAPAETRTDMAKSIRGLCNSDVKEGFVFGKDTSLPETYVKDPKKPLSNIGGKSATKRPILAFFAGSPDHGYLRPILLSYWGNNKDPDMKIFGKLPRSKGNKNYLKYMKTSKYCICAKGYEVNSPRVVEAIFYDCVPVIISDNFVPPFFEVLNWESFAVFVMEKDIPNLKNILMSISERRYRIMQMRVKRVQKHFLWHVKAEKYDMFHMILHSFWFNRVFQISV